MAESMPYHGNTSSGIVAVSRSSSRSLESCRAGNKLESWKVSAYTNIGAVFLREVRSSSDGLPRGHDVGKFLTPPSRAGSAFVTLFLSFFWVVRSVFFLFQSPKGRVEGGEGKGIGYCHTLDRVNAV